MKILLHLQNSFSYNNNYPLYYLDIFFVKPFGCLKDCFDIKVMAPEEVQIQYEHFLKEDPLTLKKITALDMDAVTDFFKNAENISVSCKEIRDCFNGQVSDWEIYLKDLNGKISDKEEKNVKELLLGKLHGWTPDIVISYPNHFNILNRIFDKSLVLTMENSVFSRPPFPRTIYLDPLGSLETNFMVEFKEEIKNFEITAEQNEKVERLKSFIVNKLKKDFDIEDIIRPYKEKFRKLVLCPLIGIYKGGKLSDFHNDPEVIEFVMSKVSSNVGVIFTGHPGTNGLQRGSLWYYREKYPNFIFLPELTRFPMQSPPLFPYIDAIINPYSATGIMALFWDVPIVPLCGYYNDWFKDCDSIDQLEELFLQKKQNKNNILYWYLTHYVCFSRRFGDASFWENYFNNKLEKFRTKGITFDFYEQNDDFDDIAQNIMEAMVPQKKKKKKKPWIKRATREVGKVVRFSGQTIKNIGQRMYDWKNK